MALAAARNFSRRRAGANDIGAIEALQRAAYARNRDLLGVELADYGEIVARMEVWLFTAENALSGVLALEAEPGALLIWSVATAPIAQGLGLGGAMLDFAEVRARELGLPALRLYTGERLVHNVAWYRRRGFAIERVEPRADRTIVHMNKRLVEP